MHDTERLSGDQITHEASGTNGHSKAQPMKVAPYFCPPNVDPFTTVECSDPRRRAAFFNHLFDPKMTRGHGRHLWQVGHDQDLVVRREIGEELGKGGRRRAAQARVHLVEKKTHAAC